MEISLKFHRLHSADQTQHSRLRVTKQSQSNMDHGDRVEREPKRAKVANARANAPASATAKLYVWEL